jgi:hypothetical protein
MKIRFKTTEKKSKEYNYTESTWDLTNQLKVDEFLKVSHYPFKKGGWIEKDNKKTCGYSICVTDEWKNKEKVLYLLVIGGKILKGGKSKRALPRRTYGAGTEINWTMKGSPSDTNYVYSQIFRQCLEDNIDIEFYLFQAPLYEMQFPVSSGGVQNVNVSPYEEMESTLNGHLMDVLGKKPIGEGNLFEQYKS